MTLFFGMNSNHHSWYRNCNLIILKLFRRQFILSERKTKRLVIPSLEMELPKHILWSRRWKSPRPECSSTQPNFYTYVEYWSYHRNSCVFSIPISFQEKTPKQIQNKTPQVSSYFTQAISCYRLTWCLSPNCPFFLGYCFQSTNKAKEKSV